MAASIKPWSDGETSETDTGVKSQTSKLKVEIVDFATELPDFADRNFAIKARIAHSLVDGKPAPAVWMVEDLAAAEHNIYLPATYDNITGIISIDKPAATLMLNSNEIYLTDFVVAAKLKSDVRPFAITDEIYNVSVSNVTPNLVINKTDGTVKVLDNTIKLYPMTGILGDGSTLFPFEVTSGVNKELFQNQTHLSSSFIVVENLIDFSAENWIPIATDKTFKGTFDGNGATINIDCNRAGMAAFIANAQDATIKNLTITGKIFSSANYVAGIVAKISSGSITNCVNSATIVANKANYVGGIVGDKSTSTNRFDITECANLGGIKIENNTSSTAFVGGIVGNMTGVSSKIIRSYNGADIYITNIGRVGGITGFLASGGQLIEDSYNYGKIEGISSGSKQIGGLVGAINIKVEITNSFNVGVINMTAATKPEIGAIVAKVGGTSTFPSNLYYVTDNANLFGLGYLGSVKQTSDMVGVNRVALSDLTATKLNNGNRSVWVDVSGSFPILTWQNK